jgi:TRAP-type C4-dicarboxylate transport system permease small subunit
VVLALIVLTTYFAVTPATATNLRSEALIALFFSVLLLAGYPRWKPARSFRSEVWPYTRT